MPSRRPQYQQVISHKHSQVASPMTSVSWRLLQTERHLLSQCIACQRLDGRQSCREADAHCRFLQTELQVSSRRNASQRPGGRHFCGETTACCFSISNRVLDLQRTQGYASRPCLDAPEHLFVLRSSADSIDDCGVSVCLGNSQKPFMVIPLIIQSLGWLPTS